MLAGLLQIFALLILANDEPGIRLEAARRAHDLPAVQQLIVDLELLAEKDKSALPRETLARAYLLEVELLEGEPKELREKSARKGLDIAHGLDESSAKWLVIMGLQLALGKLEAAREAMEKAEELDPGNNRLLLAKAKLHWQQEKGSPEAAEKIRSYLDQLLEAEPTLESALLLRAKALYALGEVELARKDLAAVYRWNPDAKIPLKQN